MNPFVQALIAFASGMAIAVTNVYAGARKGRADRDATASLQTQKERHELTLQVQREAHEARLRSEIAHDAARPDFLPVAESIALYFTKLAYDIHWEEIGEHAFPGTDRDILSSQTQVMDAVRRIMWGHPSVGVRKQADRIFNQLTSLWYDLSHLQQRTMDGETEINQKEANELEREASKLIQLVHSMTEDSRELGPQ